MALALFSVNELQIIEAEPRIQDLRLAEALGFSKTANIRQLIERNRAELELDEPVFCTIQKTSVEGGRPGTEYWLTELQALNICMRSDAPNAPLVRREIALVFKAWRHGTLTTSTAAPITEVVLRQIVFDGVRPISERIERIEGNVDRMARHVAEIKYKQSLGRRSVTDATKVEHVDAAIIMGGLCPCCGFAKIIVDGKRSPFAEFDHFYSSSQPSIDHTWLICKPCHSGLTTGEVPRHRREAEFRAYQEKRRRLPGRQTKLLF